MRITAKWIHSNKSGEGGWNEAQLLAIGASWPPEKGWIGRAIGKEISTEQRRMFEAHSKRLNYEQAPADHV